MSLLPLKSAIADDSENDDQLARILNSPNKSIGLSPYLPIYIGFTPYHSDSSNFGELKFQFSAKFEILSESEWYFAYTQKSFWSIQKLSQPFRESNFSPETFYQFKESDLDWLPAVQIGFFRHESTGEGGVGSHGWNTSYLEPIIHWNNLYVIPRVWAPLLFNRDRAAPDNPDIFRYFGYGNLTAIYGFKNYIQLSLALRYAPIDGSVTWEGQIDLSCRKISDITSKIINKSEGKFCKKVNPSLFFQGRSGYGEGLKTYNVKTSSLVAGISLVK
jgi:phospholipase A1